MASEAGLNAIDRGDLERLAELSIEAGKKSGDRLLALEIERLCEKVTRIVDGLPWSDYPGDWQ